MPITLDNVGIVVQDMQETIAFFTDLGLRVLGHDEVGGEWVDTLVGLDDSDVRLTMLTTPDGRGRLQLVEYLHPEPVPSRPVPSNQAGLHRVAFEVDDIDASLAVAARHGCYPVRCVAEHLGLYRLTYVRGPGGIRVMLMQRLRRD
ncbi:VOC family protein [Litorihabitans aurantiacus]|uniref:Glyoxalase n=1 Tax=Litorihabitans aurantiacus TaxID=1930061 RepID=A0AA37XHV9_9MICO|nr:VOC family protein [Litorihabitans aurantiacus]GMA32900.1 glyoxalase [Litorihabitans aurantiacus]